MTSQDFRVALFLALAACSGSSDVGTGSGSAGSAGSGGSAGSAVNAGPLDKNVALSVDGHDVDMSSYKVAFGVLQGPDDMHVHASLENLVLRELLAIGATEKGLKVTPADVDVEIKAGNFMLAGQRHSLGPLLTENGAFSEDKLKQFAAQLNVSVDEYRAEQARELLAVQMATSIGDIQVSEADAKAEFMRLSDMVAFDAVVFPAERFAASMHPTAEDLARFESTHTDEVKARFTQDATLYKARKPELKLREIAITGADRAAGKAKLDAARADIAAGKLKFADAAKQLATDPQLRDAGGDVGWRLAERAALGDKALSDAVKTLKPGEMTPVIASDNGAFLAIAEEARQGDLTYDQVKLEIAQTLAKDAWAAEAARRAAIATLDKLRAGDKSLTDLFPRPPRQSEKEVADIMKMLAEQAGQLTDVQKKKLLDDMAHEGHKSTGDEPKVPPKKTADAAPNAVSTPSKDVLPAFTAPAAVVESFGPVPKGMDVSGLKLSKADLAGLFALDAGNVAPQVIEAAPGIYVVAQVEFRQQPDAGQFAAVQADLIARMKQQKGETALHDWLKSHCEAAAKKIRVNPEIKSETPYVPCVSQAQP